MGHGRVIGKKQEGSEENSVSEGDQGQEVDVLEYWSFIEADFQREYRIDLVKEAYTMSARRFFSLLRGLSGDSTLRIMMREENKVISNPDAAMRAVDRVWG